MKSMNCSLWMPSVQLSYCAIAANCRSSRSNCSIHEKYQRQLWVGCEPPRSIPRSARVAVFELAREIGGEKYEVWIHVWQELYVVIESSK